MRLLFIDGNNLTMRALYANDRLCDSRGRPVGAIFGALRTLFKVAGDVRPVRVFWFWDGARSRYRTDLYPEYKQRKREIEPWRLESFREQVAMLQEYLEPLGIVQVRLPTEEADDLIHWLAGKFQDEEVVIASADRDFFQLISPRVRVYNLADNMIFDLKKFQKRFGIMPAQWPLVRAISGDDSDNIKGVPGFGDVRSLKAVQVSGDLPGLRKGISLSISGLSPKLAHELESSLGVVERNLCLIDLAKYPVDRLDEESLLAQVDRGLALGFHPEKFRKICDEHEFRTLLADSFEWEFVYEG